MAKKQLYAKDKRRRRNRRIGAVIIGGLALGGLGLAAKWLWDNVINARAKPPGTRKDWSGCGKVPEDVSPKPYYECDAVVTFEGKVYTITGRTWSSSAGYGGMWVYDLEREGESIYTEEANLSPVQIASS